MGFYKDLVQIFYYVIRSFKMIFKKKNLFFIGVIVFVVLIFGFYSNVFATIDFDYSVIDNATIRTNGDTATIVSNDIYDVYYFETDRNYIYSITNNGSATYRLWYSPTLPSIGSQLSTLYRIPAGTTYSFSGSGIYYVDLTVNVDGDASTGDYTITREPVNGFDDTTDKLTNEISVNNLWSVFPPLLVALGVLFALGYVVVKKVLKDDNRVY